MKVGAILPNSGRVPLELGIGPMVEAACAAGATGLWVSDHLVLGEEAGQSYPYNPDGKMTWDPATEYLEALTTCAFAAAHLGGDCTIGTAVMVLPQRPVLQTAKEIATLDRLSGGRLRLGLGAGWNAVEMEALGYDFGARGGRFDEMLHVLRDAWSGRTSAFSGDQLAVPEGLLLRPPPVHSAGPPLLVGGMTRPAVRRAARSGDGWLALAFADRWDRTALAAGIADFHREWSEARRGEDPQTVLKLHCTVERSDELPERVAEAASLGFDEVAIELPWSKGIAPAVDLLTELVRTQGGRSASLGASSHVRGR